MKTLRGKVVLITGASSGIGRATALRLASAGGRLVLASRNVEALESACREAASLGAEAIVVPTDVTQREQCRRAVEAAVERFGRLDVLLCCAGVSMRGAFTDSDLDALEQVMRVNFFGTLHTAFFAVPHLKKTQGSLAAVTSLTGKRAPPYYAMYAASKFAVQGLFESLRVELAPFGVHVGVVAPAFVDTPLRENILGPDGRHYETPPKSPFKVWPVEKCVDLIVQLLLERRGELLLPWLVRPLLALDEALGGRLGDRYLARKFGCRPPGSSERGT
jgi:NAD(P)-dependent dehydrogenase (short-subunit alcohol dehydrogenase family)